MVSWKTVPYSGALLFRTPDRLILWYWLVTQYANVIKYVVLMGKKGAHNKTDTGTESKFSFPKKAVIPSEAQGLDHCTEM